MMIFENRDERVRENKRNAQSLWMGWVDGVVCFGADGAGGLEADGDGDDGKSQAQASRSSRSINHHMRSPNPFICLPIFV
jgi:hypothetical protein